MLKKLKREHAHVNMSNDAMDAVVSVWRFPLVYKVSSCLFDYLSHILSLVFQPQPPSQQPMFDGGHPLGGLAQPSPAFGGQQQPPRQQCQNFGGSFLGGNQPPQDPRSHQNPNPQFHQHPQVWGQHSQHYHNQPSESWVQGGNLQPANLGDGKDPPIVVDVLPTQRRPPERLGDNVQMTLQEDQVSICVVDWRLELLH